MNIDNRVFMINDICRYVFAKQSFREPLCSFIDQVIFLDYIKVKNFACAWQHQQNVRPAKAQISLGIRPI